MQRFQSMAPRARVAVVGSGRMGQIRTSLLRANPRFSLAGIVDTHRASAQALGEQYGVSQRGRGARQGAWQFWNDWRLTMISCSAD